MNRVLFVSFIFFVLFTSCSRKTVIKTDSGKIKMKTKEKLNVQRVMLRTMSSKSKIEYTDGMDQFSANMSIRLRVDSVIWFSITPGLGIELVRGLVTKDSVYLLNRLQKEYYIYSFRELSKKLNFDINYDLLQSILLANMPYDQSEEDSVYKDSVFTLVRQVRKNVLAENYVRTSSFNLENLFMRDVRRDNMLSINYSDFVPLNGFRFPNTCKISLKYRNKEGFVNTYIGIEHKKLDTSDEDRKYPFHIPGKFERK